MEEVYEFRIYDEYASEVSGAQGWRTSVSASVRVVRGVVEDQQYRRIGEVDKRLHQEGKGRPFAGWQITRKYTAAEIEKAELFLLDLTYVHASGEEYGTQYSDAPLNPDCGVGCEAVKVELQPFRVFREKVADLRCAVGSRQIGPLIIPAKKP